jgi:DNA-binding NarL/FixJ family response regulator
MTDRAKRGVLVVDDHPVVRQGLSQLINQEEDLRVVGEAEDIDAAMAAVAEARPDIVLVDIQLNGASGIELIKQLKSSYGRCPVLVVTMYDETLYAERLLRAGARGYIMKQEATDQLLAAIRRVLDGEVYLSPKMVSRILHKLVDGPTTAALTPIDRLSDRELEVFQLIGQGLGTRQIAEQISVSIKTVETYRAHIKDKLKLKTAAEVFQQASSWVHSGGVRG